MLTSRDRLGMLILFVFGGACSDPPPYAAAGRLFTLPGDAAGAALVAVDANVSIGTAADASPQRTGTLGDDAGDAQAPDGS